jgi:cell division protein FtsB
MSVYLDLLKQDDSITRIKALTEEAREKAEKLEALEKENATLKREMKMLVDKLIDSGLSF